MQTSPFVYGANSVSRIMVYVMLALLPVFVAAVYWFGAGVIKQAALAAITALAAEALMLTLTARPVLPALWDGSALVTALLIALSFPPQAPWWLIVVGTAFALVIAKHLYGGLGQNPFNPAMVAFAVCMISFPALMTAWPDARPAAWQSSPTAVTVDAVNGATPLDHVKTALKASRKTDESPQAMTRALADARIKGALAGRGWEWINLAALVGGLLLLSLRIISWHVPLTFLATLVLISTLAWQVDPGRFAPPWFHLLSGGTMLAAFFIATDPVTAPTTALGKCLFAAAIAVLTYVIRVFGGYPDGVAFAVLLLNIATPLLDRATTPAIFGMKSR